MQSCEEPNTSFPIYTWEGNFQISYTFNFIKKEKNVKQSLKRNYLPKYHLGRSSNKNKTTNKQLNESTIKQINN